MEYGILCLGATSIININSIKKANYPNEYE